MVAMTKEMYSMPARHENDWSDGCKQVFATNGAITFQTSFDAFVCFMIFCCQTGITLVTMDVIFPQTNSAHATLFTMKNFLIGVIVPEFTMITIMFGEVLSAGNVYTNLPGPLNSITRHTHAKSSFEAIDFMI